MCDKLLSTGQCSEPKRCLWRHPKDCRHWTGDSRGCLRGNICKFMHNSSKKGMNIKAIKSNQDIKSREKNKTDDEKMIIEIKDDKMIESLKEALAVKDKLIEEQTNDIAKLRSENESLMEQNIKISRCARKMDQEIKELRSKIK